MTLFLKKTFGFLGIILSCFTLSAKNQPRVEFINIDDGLPQNTVQSIEKDEFGFMWIGTDNGLCRYDGYSFEYYYSDGGDSALWDNRILSLESDNDHSIWVTSQKGVQVLDLFTGRFKVIEDDKILRILKLDVIETLKTSNSIWIVTKTNGIFQLKEEGNNLLEVGHYWNNDTLPNPNCIYQSTSNKVCLGTELGLYIFNESSSSFESMDYNRPEISNTSIQSILDDERYLYLGTENGLYLIDKGSLNFIPFYADVSNVNSLNHPNVTALIKVNANELHIGTLGGICRLYIDEQKIERVSLIDNTIESQVEFVSSIYADEQGNVWVGAEKVGLAHYNIHQKNFLSLDNLGDGLDELNEDIINSIYKTRQSLWIGTAGKGLAKINTSKGHFRYFQSQTGNASSIESNFITSVCEDSKGDLWVGTWGMGLQKLVRGKGENFISYQIDKGLPSSFVSCIYKNSKGHLVIGTQGGLCIYNEKQDYFYSVLPANDGLASSWEVGCLIEDKHGFYWVGTTSGLYRFNSRLVSLTEPTIISKYEQTLFKETQEPYSLPNNYIACLTSDSKGNIWLGTYGGGVAKCVEIEGGNYQFESLIQKDGLANNVVYNILCDDKDNLWIATENGLSKYSQAQKHFVNYYKQDGLRNNQYYWSAAFKDDEGYLYFGGLKGLNFFHPDSIQQYPFKTSPSITSLNIYNQKVVPGQKYNGVIPLKKSAFANDTIRLSYKDKVFSIEFSAMNYLHSGKIKYAYKMEGVDKDWVEVDSKRRMASYTNLAGGLYLFQVKSTNLEGLWEENVAQVYVDIIPPLWQRMWFKIVLVVFLIVLISVYIQYRSFRISMQKKRLEFLVKERTVEIQKKNKQLEESSSRLMESNTQLEKRRNKIEIQKKQLEDQNKEIISQRDQLISLNEKVESIHQMRMQFFTNISHEFRTPLTLIISPVERILSDSGVQLSDSVRNAISVVKRNAERLLMLTNQILTFRKLEAGKLNVLLREGAVDEAVIEIGGAFNELAQEKNISYDLQVNKGDYDGWYDKSKLENILFNLLSNAFKYTSSEGHVMMNVDLIEEDSKGKCIEIKIKDDGEGIKPDVIDKIFDRFYRAENTLGFGTGIGLSLVKELVEKQNGHIVAESEYKSGTTFIVTLPIEKDAFDDYTIVDHDINEPLSLKEKVNLVQPSKTTESENIPEDGASKPEIMVVEDNDDLRHFLAESLKVYYRVITARDGQEGYELALKNDVELVVSDVMMPRLNGFDLCKQLKNNLNTSHLPVILLSAKGVDENQIEGLGVGADDYIVKPFNFTLLQAKIKSLIDNRFKLKKFYLQNSAEDQDLQSGTLDDEFMQKVNDVVSEHYVDASFDIETFSSKMFVSRSLLYKKLKALTNVSPNEYINVFRLKKSIPLLKSKKYQVGEVAIMVGFNDPKYFSRVFKKFYNCSPSEYVNG